MANGYTNVPGVSAAMLGRHTANTENPHKVTKEQLGLNKVDNTSDKEKPVSEKQADAIADAKRAGTDAMAAINGHIKNKTNPHGVTAEQVGADPNGAADSAVSAHNTDSSAHADIRSIVNGLTNRLNALADSDDVSLDQLSEIVAYIKNNKTLIESVTTSKVNVSDVVNNLVTNISNKPLSAAMGVELKRLIDNINIGTDTTLSTAGKAADAKAVGDQLSQLSTKIGDRAAKPVCLCLPLPASAWTGNQQVVTVPGVTTDCVVFVAAAEDEEQSSEYVNCGIWCSAQKKGQLTFDCTFVPLVDLTVNVSIFT